MNLRLGRDDEDKIYIRKASTLREKLGQEDVHKLACRDVAKFIAQILRLIATIIFMLKISKTVEEPLENMGASATGQIFAERDSGILGRLSGVFSSSKTGQSGGAIDFTKRDTTLLRVNGNTPKDVFLKYFKFNQGMVYLENTQTNISSLITLQPEFLKLNGCNVTAGAPGTPGGLVAPSPLPFARGPGTPGLPGIPAGDTIPLTQYLNENRSYTCAEVLNNPDDDNSSKYVIRYIFNKHKETKYAFTFHIVFTTDERGDVLVMNNFEWDENARPQDASDLRSRKPSTIRCVISETNLLVMNGRGEPKKVQIYIYDKCKEIESESWNNPDEDRASKYLILWRYLLPERGSERYVPLRGMNELLFDEETRDTPKGMVLYKKPVQVANRTRDITFACEFSIENKGLQSDGQYLYSLTVHNIEMATTIQGINFDPISELEPRNFISRNKGIAPTDKESNTVLQYLKQVLSKNIVRTGATGRTYRYVRPQEGERMYKIPEERSRQDDLGALQKRMLSFETLPACSARARELLTKIGDNRYLSSVCNAKFRYRVNGSLPKTKEITGSHGIDALRSLFKFIGENVPNVNATKEWEEFKQNMQEMGGYDLRAKCDKRFEDGMELPIGVANDVRGVVGELVAMEQAKISTMLDLLFQIISRPALDEDGEIKLDERLFEEGMPRVIEITREVIEAAKNYYIRCDTTYNKALRRILDSNESKKPENPPKRGTQRPATENDDEEGYETNNTNGDDEAYKREGPYNRRGLPFDPRNI